MTYTIRLSRYQVIFSTLHIMIRSNLIVYEPPMVQWQVYRIDVGTATNLPLYVTLVTRENAIYFGLY